MLNDNNAVNAGARCLSEAQIASVNAIREPWANAVVMAHGVTRYAGYGVTGDEDSPRYQYAFYPVGTVPPSQPLPPGRGSGDTSWPCGSGAPAFGRPRRRSSPRW